MFLNDNMIERILLLRGDKMRLEMIGSNIKTLREKHGISQAAFMSKTECYRLFKQYLGLTPMEYVLNQRLQHASMLLLDSNDSIVNIALNCGFNSSSYFSKKFKNHYHQTPKEFRQQN